MTIMHSAKPFLYDKHVKSLILPSVFFFKTKRFNTQCTKQRAAKPEITLLNILLHFLAF